jgi:predicted MFS family arabinose efflux permease
VLSIRDLFPNREAGWRVPILLLAGQSGMAAGSWLAGALYDWSGTYAAAFVTGAGFNLANLVLLGVLLGRRSRRLPMPA